MKKSILILAFFFLPIAAGCGFSPAYQKGSETGKFLESVYFSDPVGELDFLFLNAIEGKIQNRSNSNYFVSYTVTVSGQSTFGERVNLSGTVKFSVKDVLSDLIIYDGSVSNFVNYTSLGGLNNIISTNTSRDAALERLMNLLADSVRTRLIIISSNP